MVSRLDCSGFEELPILNAVWQNETMTSEVTPKQRRFALKMMLVYALVVLFGIFLTVWIGHFFHFQPAFWHFHITRPVAPQG
jgi:uncharacterized BrkB/YihY/UPF0761 family membrane protein